VTTLAKPWDTYQVNLLTVERPNKDLQDLLSRIGMVFLRAHGRHGDGMYCHKSKEAEFMAKIGGWNPEREVGFKEDIKDWIRQLSQSRQRSQKKKRYRKRTRKSTRKRSD
jgi:hypothetical protein